MANPNQPPSFKTNVHRAPTKKWADAKSYNYSGDDWGGYDEFDEYGTYDEPPAPSKPTGLRQRGQDASATTHKRYYNQTHDSQSSTQASQPLVERSSFTSGDDMHGLPRQVLGKQSSSSSSGASSPVKTWTSTMGGQAGPDILPSATLSESSRKQGFRQPSPPDTSQAQSRQTFDPTTQTFGPGDQFDRSSPSQASRLDGLPEETFSNNDGPADFTSSNRMARDYPPALRTRRDFVPSSMPPQLSSRSMAANPGIAPEQAQPTRFPPRKSSLTSQTRPDVSAVQEQSIPIAPSTQHESMDQKDLEKDDDLSDSVTPHFIRPAEIYRRMEQERARQSQRQSQDSDRPSVDLSKANAAGSMQISQLGQSVQPASATQLTNSLEPVAERKSEYGMESIIGQPSATFKELDTEFTHKPPVSVAEYLPRIDRFSGLSSFGADTWNSLPTNDASTLLANDEGSIGSRRFDVQAPKSNHTDNIRDAVTTAFEHDHDSSVPETPNSGTGTDQWDDISRSNTDSTAGISPITNDMRGRSFQSRDQRFSPLHPAIAETAERQSPINPRPSSSDTLPGRGGPGQTVQSDAVIGVPQNYRRYSPGHTLSIETQTVRPESEEGSVVETPANAAQEDRPSTGDVSATLEDYQEKGSSNYETREADLAAAVNSSSAQEVPGVADAAIDAQREFLRRSLDQQAHGSSLSDLSNPSRAEDTPTDNQDSFDTRHVAQPISGKSDSLIPRPGLPGEWISYSSVDSEETGKYLQVDDYRDEDDDDSSIVATPKGMRAQSPARSPPSDPDFAPNQSSAASSQVNVPDPGRMAALAAAGAAMASSLQGKGKAAEPRTHTVIDSLPNEKSVLPQHLSGTNMAPSISVESPGATHLAKNISGPRTAARIPGMFNTADESIAHVVPIIPTDEASLQRHSNLSPMSDESSIGVTENDILSREIVRSLTPQAPENVITTKELTGNSEQNRLGVPDSPSADSMRASTLIPREYDSYWASSGLGDGNSPRFAPGESFTVAPETIDQPRIAEQIEEPTFRAELPSRRFSWESESGGQGSYDGYDQSKDLPGAGLGIEPNTPVTPEQAKPRLEQGIAPDGTKRNTYDLLGTTPVTATEIVSKETTKEPSMSENSRDSQERPVSGAIPANRIARPMSQPKALPFREIMALKSSADRLQTYTSTREEFAEMNTGLSNWLGYMVASHPEYVRGGPGPTVITTGLNDPSRGKASPSSGKPGSKGGLSPSKQPYYMQYSDSAAQVPGVSSQNPNEASPSSGNFFGKGRTSSGQMQAKGKDMLHSAGVFSGKAAQGAKGLFNRGKNKFKAATQDKGE